MSDKFETWMFETSLDMYETSLDVKHQRERLAHFWLSYLNLMVLRGVAGHCQHMYG